jgi:hypothetical protein
MAPALERPPGQASTGTQEGTPSDLPWREVVAAVGIDIAMPLTEAVERINAMLTAGRSSHADLRALRAAVEQARQVGIAAQQLTRFANRRLRLSHEQVQLTQALQDAVHHREREAQLRGLSLVDALATGSRPTEVLVDASLNFSLINTLIDWVLRHARSGLSLGVELTTWPAHARIHCRFAYREADERRELSAPETLDSLSWRLLEQIAQTMELIVHRQLDGHRVSLTLEFTRTANDRMEGVSSLDLIDPGNPASGSVPLVGSHVLIVASRRDVRVQLREAIFHMGLLIDMVATVDEAMAFCRDALPHGVIYEGILAGERMAQLQTEVWAAAPDVAFVEVVEEGDHFEMSDDNGSNSARVGRGAVSSSLASVLLFELSRGL